MSWTPSRLIFSYYCPHRRHVRRELYLHSLHAGFWKLLCLPPSPPPALHTGCCLSCSTPGRSQQVCTNHRAAAATHFLSPPPGGALNDRGKLLPPCSYSTPSPSQGALNAHAPACLVAAEVGLDPAEGPGGATEVGVHLLGLSTPDSNTTEHLSLLN